MEISGHQSGRPRAILHLDLDAFYASVEQLDDPRLRGRPVVVAGTSRRGVVCAASYEARRFGVRSAMPTARARRLCPGGVYLAPRFPRYQELSEKVFALYRAVTPLVEPLSLDEAFLDVTASRALHGTGAEIARALRAAVRREVGLAVSAGVAEVKMAAKIASDLAKPDGLLEVPQGGVRAFLAPLPVGRLWGVGEVTGAALTSAGLHRIGALADAPELVLAGVLGARQARELRALARGEDPRPVVAGGEVKSVGGEETFERDLVGREALLPRLLHQAERVGRRLRSKGLRGRVVTLVVKYADFERATRRATLPSPTDDGRAIYRAAVEALGRVDEARPMRLLGVSVSGLVDELGGAEDEAEGKPQPSQLDLFAVRPGPGAAPAEAAEGTSLEEKRAALNAAVDRLGGKYGPGTVRPATLLENEADDD